MAYPLYMTEHVYSPGMHSVPAGTTGTVMLHRDRGAAAHAADTSRGMVPASKVIYPASWAGSDGRLPSGTKAYRRVLTHGGVFVGATDWYVYEEDAVDEWHVLMRKREVPFDNAFRQEGVVSE